MKLKELHAHFLISIGEYCNERIGFVVRLDDEDKAEEIVAKLREKARSIVGPDRDTLYAKRNRLQGDCNALEAKLKRLVEEWNKTADFLRAQGIKPEAPSMPNFGNLLAAADRIESENIAEFEEEDDDDRKF